MKKLSVIFILVIIVYTAMLNLYPDITPAPKVDFDLGKIKKIVKIFQPKEHIQLPEKADLITQDYLKKDTWMGFYGFFALVGKNDIAIRQSPDAEAPILSLLPRLQRVRVEAVKPIKKGKKMTVWVFLKTENGEEVLGWIEKDHLVFKTNFKPVEDWDFEKITLFKGEYFARYETHFKGYFTNQWRAKGEEIVMEGTRKGRLYEHENIIWAKKKEEPFWIEFFYLDDDGKLHHEWKYKKQPIKTE
mgnify:CR=1 FL=1